MTHWTIDLAWQYLLTRSLISILGSFWARNFWYLNCKKHVNFYIRIHFKSSRSWNFLKCLIFYNSYFLNLGTRILFLSCGWARRWSLLILVPRATQLNLQPCGVEPLVSRPGDQRNDGLWGGEWFPLRVYSTDSTPDHIEGSRRYYSFSPFTTNIFHIGPSTKMFEWKMFGR